MSIVDFLDFSFITNCQTICAGKYTQNHSMCAYACVHACVSVCSVCVCVFACEFVRDEYVHLHSQAMRMYMHVK